MKIRKIIGYIAISPMILFFIVASMCMAVFFSPFLIMGFLYNWGVEGEPAKKVFYDLVDVILI